VRHIAPSFRLLPESATPDAARIVAARGLRAFADGFVSITLPAYLLALGFDAIDVGVLSTATLLGSAAATLGVGWLGARARRRTLLLIAAALMIATGLGFAALQAFWPLLVIAAVGTLNPSAGDASVFLPLEQATLAGAAADKDRTALFARYAIVASLGGAFGALFAGLPALAGDAGGPPLWAFQAMFVLYAAIGLAAAALYRRLDGGGAAPPAPAAPLGPSRRRALGLAALFSIDTFAGGLIVQSMVALWFFERFGLPLAAAANVFFAANLLAAASYLAAVPLARRIGLINTMVFTHLPSSIVLMLIPFADSVWVAVALWIGRNLLSQMDVPTRTSYVMAVVTAPERAAAASFTAVPRSLAGALGPAAAGLLLAATPFGWSVLLAGALKAAYDIALWVSFNKIRPPEETR
jgi:MFS family permease